MKVYTVAEALKVMDSGEPFDISWVTADRRRNTGGEIIEAKGAMLRGGKYKTRGGTAVAQKQSKRFASAANPNHYAHGTRNIYLKSERIRKVHIQLIISINQVPVV